jgi:hypothetical protein
LGGRSPSIESNEKEKIARTVKPIQYWSCRLKTQQGRGSKQAFASAKLGEGGFL